MLKGLDGNGTDWIRINYFLNCIFFNYSARFWIVKGIIEDGSDITKDNMQNRRYFRKLLIYIITDSSSYQ